MHTLAVVFTMCVLLHILLMSENKLSFRHKVTTGMWHHMPVTFKHMSVMAYRQRLCVCCLTYWEAARRRQTKSTEGKTYCKQTERGCTFQPTTLPHPSSIQSILVWLSSFCSVVSSDLYSYVIIPLFISSQHYKTNLNHAFFNSFFFISVLSFFSLLFAVPLLFVFLSFPLILLLSSSFPFLSFPTHFPFTSYFFSAPACMLTARLLSGAQGGVIKIQQPCKITLKAAF